jgi:hypothetical protein
LVLLNEMSPLSYPPFGFSNMLQKKIAGHLTSRGGNLL